MWTCILLSDMQFDSVLFSFFWLIMIIFFTHLHYYLIVLHTNLDKITKKQSHTCMGFDLGTSRSRCRGLNQYTTGE